jgi:hypothetical protein
MQKLVLHGYKEKGVGIVSNRGMGKDFVDALPDGAKYRIVMERYYPNRSEEQNAYYWGVVIKMLSNEMSLNKDATHRILTAMFLAIESVDEFGNAIQIIPSTSKLSTVEFNNYMDEIKQFAAETFDIVIPDPEQDYML